jgi:hypothetical protein
VSQTPEPDRDLNTRVIHLGVRPAMLPAHAGPVAGALNLQWYESGDALGFCQAVLENARLAKHLIFITHRANTPPTALRRRLDRWRRTSPEQTDAPHVVISMEDAHPMRGQVETSLRSLARQRGIKLVCSPPAGSGACHLSVHLSLTGAGMDPVLEPSVVESALNPKLRGELTGWSLRLRRHDVEQTMDMLRRVKTEANHADGILFHSFAPEALSTLPLSRRVKQLADRQADVRFLAVMVANESPHHNLLRKTCQALASEFACPFASTDGSTG